MDISAFVDIFFIGHITNYLARNVRPIFHIYSSILSDWCIVAQKTAQGIFSGTYPRNGRALGLLEKFLILDIPWYV